MRTRAQYLENHLQRIIAVNRNCLKSDYLQSRKETVLKSNKEKAVREL